MSSYDFYCKDWRGCGGKIDDIQSEEEPSPRPLCPKCGGEMNSCAEHYGGGAGVAFKGLSTPGHGTSSANFKNLPKEIQGWAKNKTEQDRHFENEVKKPMTWPDGTHQKGIK